MRKTITKIRGLKVNVEVVEVHQQDPQGVTLWYYAAIYIQPHGSIQKTLIRKSRLPGAAAELKREIQRDGLRAFDRWSTHMWCRQPALAAKRKQRSLNALLSLTPI
ncbi:hypothetical protein [Rhizobium sp. RCC_161_2]|uniref:hypothetical protein n=1 Tax=Rhizobium sp. RCC_161_2 TaxID=3239219 RepID=UPI003525D5A8